MSPVEAGCGGEAWHSTSVEEVGSANFFGPNCWPWLGVPLTSAIVGGEMRHKEEGQEIGTRRIVEFDSE